MDTPEPAHGRVPEWGTETMMQIPQIMLAIPTISDRPARLGGVLDQRRGNSYDKRAF